MIAIPISAILEKLIATKGKSNIQLEVERELRSILAKRDIASVTGDQLAALFEEAAMEVAFRDVTAKMRREGKIPNLAPANDTGKVR